MLFHETFFWDENWLFDNYKAFMSSIGGYHNIHTFRLYKYWYENIDEKFIKKINYRFNNFVNSYENRLSNFSSEKIKIFFKLNKKIINICVELLDLLEKKRFTLKKKIRKLQRLNESKRS